MDLKNKNILITGASSGIGQALSLELAKKQANLILLGKDEKKINQIYDQVSEINANGNHSICLFDLAKTSQKDYENLQNSLKNEYQSLDVLFHNAAILDKLCPIELYEPYLWLSVMQVNVNASFLLTHYLLALLKNQSGGQIWFMSSSVASHPKANWGAYSASKSAQDCFMQTLAIEQSNLIVNSINPKSTRTKMRAIAYPFENQDQLTSADARAKQIIELMTKTKTSGKVIDLN